MAEILHRIEMSTDPMSVYNAVSQQAGLAAWWTPRVETSAELLRERGIISSIASASERRRACPNQGKLVRSVGSQASLRDSGRPQERQTAKYPSP